MALLQKVKDIYRALPPWLTAPVKYVPDGLLFGRSFRACEPRTDLACLGPNLKAALDYAREHTVWGRENIPDKIAAEDAGKIVADLPVVGSQDISAAPEKFVSDEATEFNSYWTTTGMTKLPTHVKLSNSAYGVEWKHMLRIWELGGYNRQRDLKLTFRGYKFKPGEFVRFDPIYNELSVDAFQVNNKTFPDFLSRIRRANIACIHGYPTLIKMFKERLENLDERFNVREIMLASEGASVALKQELADFFHARVMSWYGLTEKLVLAYDEKADGRFVNFTSYGYPRIVDLGENGVGEIVGTTFVNPAMPLVNYRTGDYGRIIREKDCMYIVDLQGRSAKDFVYESPDVKYSLTAIGAPDEVYRKMLFFQVIQHRYAEIEVLLLIRKEWQHEGDALLKQMRKSYETNLPRFKLTFRLVDDDSQMERSGRGKLRKLVQDLKI